MNMIPGKYTNKLTSPFMLVHGVCLNSRTWVPIFSICYFHHEKDSNTSRSKSQAHTMDGIVMLSVDLLLLMPSLYTTPRISSITNLKPTNTTYTAFHCQFIPQSSKTVVSLFLSPVMTTRPSANHIPLVHRSSTPPLDKVLLALSWTSLSTPLLHLNTSLSLTMA